MLKSVFNDSALNSTNSALEENEKYLESIEGHLQKFQNAVQNLYYSLLDSGIINNVIDLGTKFINILDSIVEKLGSAGSLVATGGLVLTLRNLSDILPFLIQNLPKLVPLINDIVVSLSSGIGLGETLTTLLPGITASIAAAGPYILAIGAAIAVIGGLIWVWDKTHESVEEATEALEDAKEAWEDATEEIEKAASELDEVNEKIKALESQDSLSFTDEQELNKLRTQKQLLEESLKLSQEIAEQNSKNVVTQTNDLFQIKFGNDSGTTDIDALVKKLQSGEMNIQGVLDSAEENVGDALALYEYYSNEMAKATEETEIAEYQEYLDLLASYIEDLAPDALTSLLDMQQGLIDVGAENSSVYASLEKLKREIYSIYDPAQLKTLKFEEIFDITGLELTRDKLLELASSGELDENTISQYGALRKAIFDAGLTVDEFIQQLEAEAAALETVEEVTTKYETTASTLAESLSTITSQVSPLFEDLATLYDEIFNGDNGFTLEDIDYDDLQSLVEDITADLEDLGFEFSDAEQEANDFLRVLSDSSSTEAQVQDAFDKIATAILDASDTYGTLNEETAAQMVNALESIGVTNALEVVTEKLAAAQAYNTVQTDLASGASAEHANALLIEANASDYARAAAFQLALTEANLSGDSLDFSAKIASLEELANAYLDTALAAQIAAKADWANEQVAAGMMSEDAAFKVVQNYAKNLTASLASVHVDYSHTADASSGGSSDADTYTDAYEEELEALEAQRDAGIISEAEFLEKWKELILKYFGDIDKYGEEYAEQMAEYWEEYIDYMEDVISAIGTLLDKKIDAAEEGKDAAVSALEEEQEAAEKYYQDQIDYLDDLIENLEDEKDALQDQIDVIQDQIDALEDANDERERAINLQKAQYALQQAMNQRTLLQYVGGQMVYTQDTSAVRDAKSDVEDAEYEITIAALEKQIELLEDQQDAIDKQIEAYEKQQEALQDLLDASNDYYDNLIEETENYWDSLIDSLNAQKDKWDELVEQKEIAEAFATVQEAMEALGFTVDDVLNDTPGAFEAFRDAYLGTLTDANAGNQDFLDGLNYATGGIKDALGTISEDAGTTADALSSIGEVTDTVSNAATAIGNVADNTATAATNASTLASNSETLNTNLSGVKDTVNEIAGTDLSSASGSFDALAESIKKVADALGVGDSGTVGSLSKAITDLNAMTLGGEGEGVIGSFNELAKAVGNVTSAINGGGGTETDATEATGTGMNTGSGNETASGLSGAISDLKETADTSIGENADAEEGGTVISDFNALKTAVQTVAEKIGMAGENGEASEDSLIGIIQSLPELAEEALVGESGLKSMFDELLESISACATAATTLLDSINNLGGASTGALAGVAFGNTKATGNVHIGNAYADGKLGIKRTENAIVGEAGQELIVDSSTGQYRLTHGPELTRLDRGDLVFNAEQTKAIIKNGKTDHGHSYAEGTGTLLPLTDEEMNLFRTMGEALTGIHADTTTMLEPIKSIAQKVTNNTTNIAPVINVTGTQFTVQGVTGEQVSRQISDTFSGIIANAYQRAMS